MNKSRIVRSVLHGILHHPEVARAISDTWTDMLMDLFESPEANHIARAGIKHLRQTGECLGSDSSWLDELSESGRVNESELELVEALWADAKQKNSASVKTILERGTNYLNQVALQKMAEQVEQLADKGKITLAQERLREYTPISLVPRGELHSAAESDISLMRYLYKPLLAYGYITLLEGESGTGKSTVLCDIVARITNGHTMPPKRAKPTKRRKGKNVLYITSEDGWGDLMLPRLKAAGYDFKGEHKVYSWPTDQPQPKLPRDYQELRDKIMVNNIKLVIFDPIISLMEDGYNDANSSGHVRRLMDPLNRLAQECQCAFLGVRHFTKSANGTSAMHRGAGSGAWTQACRFQWFNTRHDKNKDLYALVPSKVNTVANPTQYTMLYRIDSVPLTIKGRVDYYGRAKWVKMDSIGDRDRSADEWMYGSKKKATY